MRTLILEFLAYGVYPLWLLCGAGDYWCHRRTHIAETSGVTEGWLHIAQFVTVAIVFASAVLLQPTLGMIAVASTAALAHLALSYIDVVYTHRKRYISPLEQHVHAFMDVLPLVAVALLALIGLDEDTAMTAAWRLRELDTNDLALLLGSFAVLAGGPVIEEFLRTATNARAERKDQVATLMR